MSVFLLTNILLGVVGLIYWFIHRKLQYWKNRNVPHIEPEFFYGNARGISKTFSPNEILQQMYFKLKARGFGPAAGIYMFIQPVIYVLDLDLIKQILVKDFHIFTNRGVYHNEKDDPLSANLAAVEDDTWKSLRQKISPTFTSGTFSLNLSMNLDSQRYN